MELGSPGPLLPLQHTAHRQEGSLPQLPLHGLARDPLTGPETPRHPHPRKPRERADLLLPIKVPGSLLTQDVNFSGQF